MTPADPNRTRPDPSRLLVVDDDVTNRLSLSRRLVRRGYSVDTADGGVEALAKIQQEHYDLVLLDQMMPGMSGVDLLKLLRATYSPVELPVIMVTAVDENATLVEALEEGANDYLVKPVETLEITARIQTQLQRAKSGRSAHGGATQAGNARWSWDPIRGVAQFTPQWAALMGYPEVESENGIEAGLAEWLDRIHPQDLLRVRKQLHAHLEGDAPEFQSEHRLRRQDGQYRWMLCRATGQFGPDRALTRLSGSIADIEDRKSVDPLTGLGNRMFLLDRLATTLADEESGANWMILLLDLDGFKELNEQAGHEVSDRVLVEVAARLREEMSGLECMTLARTGADEFTVLAPSSGQDKEFETLAQSMMAALDAPVPAGEDTIQLTASLGIALSFPGAAAGQLMRHAELAMQKARSQGRHRWHAFDPDLRDRADMRATLTRDLRHALERNQLLTVYQPKVDLESQAIIGFEALMRWRHPELGLISPADFIPLAEESGLIVSAGEWILRESCGQLARWQKQFPPLPSRPEPLVMSVNLSARQLCDPDLVSTVEQVLRETRVAPHTLHLELTESSLIEERDVARGVLEKLRALGVGLMLDDFGTGYASLSYLSVHRFDALKIDRSFVSRVDTHSGSRAIVKSILELARELRMEVVAEGVETEPQRHGLTEMGCEMGQGFFFSRPVEANMAEKLLRDGVSHAE